MANTFINSPSNDPNAPILANRPPNSKPASPPNIRPFIKPPDVNPRLAVVVPLFGLVVDLFIVEESDLLVFYFGTIELLVLVVAFKTSFS